MAKTTKKIAEPADQEQLPQPQPKKRGRPRKPLTPAQQAKVDAKAQRAAELAQRPATKLGRPLALEADPGILQRLNQIIDGGMSNDERLLTGLQSGVPLELACEYAGIHRTTLIKWRQQYKEDPNQLHPNIKQFVELSQQLMAAKAIWAQQQWFMIGTGNGEGKARWESMATYLERIHPEFYSQNKAKDNNQQINIYTSAEAKANESVAQWNAQAGQFKQQQEQELANKQEAIEATPLDLDDDE